MIHLDIRKNVKHIMAGNLLGIVADDVVAFDPIYEKCVKGRKSSPIDCGEFIFNGKKVLIAKRIIELEPEFKKNMTASRVWMQVHYYSYDILNVPFTEMMPDKPWAYKVADTNPSNNEVRYIEVEVEGETDLSELVASHYKYRLNATGKTFQKISENEWKKNLHRGLVRQRINSYAGDFNARLADYGRLIAFLLQKIQPSLSDEEKQALDDVIKVNVNAQTLSRIGGREKKIYQIKNEFENNTMDISKDVNAID